MATAAELSQLRKDLYNTIRNPVEGKMAGKIISGIMMAAELIDNDGSSGGGATEQWVLDQGYLTSISGLTAGNADQLGGIDAINYARKDVAVTFNDDVTIGVGAVLSGNGSGLTHLNASNLASGTLPSARLSSDVIKLPSESSGIKYVSSASGASHTFNLSTIFSEVTFTSKAIHVSIEYLGKTGATQTESRIVHAVRAANGTWSGFNIGTSSQSGGANFSSISATGSVVTINTIASTSVGVIITLIVF